MTVFYEGDSVSFLGDGLDGIVPAEGRIMGFASHTAAHVEWLTGDRVGAFDIVDVRDLEKSASLAATASAAPLTTGPVLVRRVMHREGSVGVLSYLAATHQLSTWDEIAAETLSFVESRLRADQSMDMPHETLTSEEMDGLIRTSAQVLLRDKFGPEVA